MTDRVAHPYIPSSAPGTTGELLAAVRRRASTSSSPRFRSGCGFSGRSTCRPLSPPRPICAGTSTTRSQQNRPCDEVLSFLGGGCWQTSRAGRLRRDRSRGEFSTAFFGLGPCLDLRRLPGAVRVPEPDLRAPRARRQHRPHLRLGVGGRHRAADGGARHRPGERPGRRQRRSRAPASDRVPAATRRRSRRGPLP